MQYVRLARIPRPVSRLLFGCAYPGMIAGEDQTALLDQAFAAGVNAIDTAENYGKSELILGAWMAERNNRDQLTIITKAAIPMAARASRPRICATILRSRSSGCARITWRSTCSTATTRSAMLASSWRRSTNSFAPVKRCASALPLDDAARARGQRLRPRPRPRALQRPQSQLFPGRVKSATHGAAVPALSGEEHAADRAWCAQEGITVIAYATLAHGFLAGKVLSSEPARLEASLDEGGRRGYFYPENLERLRRAEHLAAQKGCSVAQIALAYVLTDELGILPAISATKQRHLEANIAALDIALTAEERAWLDLRA